MDWAKERIRGTALERPARLLVRLARDRKAVSYDIETLLVMRRVLRPDSVCVDVGAHQGDILKEMLRLAPNAAHHAVEPLPDFAAILRRFPVTVHEVAASDQEGESDFAYVPSAPAYSGFRQRSDVSEAVTIRVRTARLDDLVDRADFIKIDVEGAELRVFGGAGRLLRQRPYVVFEHGPVGAGAYGTRPEEVFDLLASHGLHVSLMTRWLTRRAALTRQGFTAQFDGHRNYYFLAHP